MENKDMYMLNPCSAEIWLVDYLLSFVLMNDNFVEFCFNER